MIKNKLSLPFFSEEELGIGSFRYLWGPEEKFLRVNSAFLQILGYSSKTKLNTLIFTELFINKEDKQKFFNILKKAKKVKSFETIFKKKDQTLVWVSLSAVRKFMDNKQKFIEGIVEDITIRKEREKEIVLERDFLQGLFDNIPDAIYFKDQKNRITKVNKFYMQGVGLKPEEIIGKTDFYFFPPEQAKEMFKDDNYVLTTGKSIVGKVERTLLPSGRWNQVITTKVPAYDKKGNIVGTMGITRDMTAYANLENERFTMLMNTLTVLGKALEMRDPYTFAHNQNVALIAEKLGQALNWDSNRLLGIRLAGQLHDLGKISIPLDILNKTGKLSNLEYELVQEHVEKCYFLIKDIKFPFSFSDIIYQHHERLDGSGYPNGLKGNEIILEAKILAISDVLESMTSHRPYRAALSLENALDELEKGSGIKYDYGIVQVVKNMVKDNNGQVFWLN